MESNKNLMEENKNSILEAEIDFRIFFEKITLYKNLIAKFTVIGIILGFLNAFTAKKVYEGGFEIVISEKNESFNNTLVDILSAGNLGGSKFSKGKLKTEVQILQSPSVLMDTFEFIKSKTNNQKLRFNDWKNKFTFELLPNTSILEISYRDPDKELIQETLNMISRTYQKYSGNEREREIELSIGFLNQQRPIYKEKALNSTKEAQEFAFKNDMIPPIIVNGNESDAAGLGNIGNNISLKRIDAINQIKILKAKKVELEKSDLNNEQIILYAQNSIPGSQILTTLNKTIANLSALQDIYTEKDMSIINLKSLKKQLIKDIKKQTYETIVASIKEFEAILISTERPEGVLGKYSQLVLQASQDQFAYSELEKQYRVILLEKARYKDPWKLITEPTIIPSPVEPIKPFIISMWTFIGFILGILISLYKNKIEDVVYSEIELEKLLSYKILGNLNESEESEYREELDLLLKPIIMTKSKTITFLKLLEINDYRVEEIGQYINEKFNGLNVSFLNNFKDIFDELNLILLVEFGFSKKSSIKKLKNKFLRQGIKIDGLLILSKKQINDKKSTNDFFKNIFKKL